MSKKAKEVISNIRRFVEAYRYGRGKRPEAVTLYRSDFDALKRFQDKKWKKQHGDLPPPDLKCWDGIRINIADK